MQIIRKRIVLVTVLTTVIAILYGCQVSPVDVLMGNKTHTLDCNALPTVAHVQEILAAHKDMVDRLLQINPGQVLVDADNSQCSTKADVLITVGTSQDAKAVEALIHADTFFGVPYRILNQ
jgi:hypothetical protein